MLVVVVVAVVFVVIVAVVVVAVAVAVVAVVDFALVAVVVVVVVAVAVAEIVVAVAVVAVMAAAAVVPAVVVVFLVQIGSQSSRHFQRRNFRQGPLRDQVRHHLSRCLCENLLEGLHRHFLQSGAQEQWTPSLRFDFLRSPHQRAR